MKKLSFLLATFAMLVTTVSCSKNDDDNDDEKIQPKEDIIIPSGSINLKLGISDLPLPAEAVKTGWTNGDVINIWFDKKVFQTPELALTYNNGTWEASEISDAVVSKLKTTGTIWGFYEISNSATTGAAAWTFSHGENPGLAANFDTSGSDWQTGTYGYLTADFKNICYTFDGTTLNIKLNDWIFGTDFQMVITGLDITKKWTLKGSGITNWYGIQMWIEDPDDDPFNVWYSLGGTYYPMAGMPTADGLVFYGKVNKDDSSAKNHSFTLKNVTDNLQYTFTINAKISTNQGESLYVTKIPFNSIAH